MKHKREMSDEERSENMRHLAAMLVCPHQWSAMKKARVVTEGRKPRDGELTVCATCGTNRVKWADGTASMFPPQGLSLGGGE